jgi:hypothetical protein
VENSSDTHKDKKCCIRCAFLGLDEKDGSCTGLFISARELYFNHIFRSQDDPSFKEYKSKFELAFKKRQPTSIDIVRVYDPSYLGCYQKVWSERSNLRLLGVENLGVDPNNSSPFYEQILNVVLRENFNDENSDYDEILRDYEKNLIENYRKKILLEDRNDCFFFHFIPGMEFEAAKTLEKRKVEREKAELDREHNRKIAQKSLSRSDSALEETRKSNKISLAAFIVAAVALALNFFTSDRFIDFTNTPLFDIGIQVISGIFLLVVLLFFGYKLFYKE